tara:strand:+ start:733 stop:1806 length:1074 start_codon:yes stop_codon:yes gene_type:complete
MSYIKNLNFKIIKQFITILLSCFILIACQNNERGSNKSTKYNLDNIENLNQEDTSSDDLYNVDKEVKEAEINPMRLQFIRDTAMSLGMRAALYDRSKEINKFLKEHTNELYAIFDFNALMMNHDILPPVLIEGRATLSAENYQPYMGASKNNQGQQDSSSIVSDIVKEKSNIATVEDRVNQTVQHFGTLRITDKTYQILKQARFATAIPTWREYLLMDYKKPEKTFQSLLPKNPVEQKAWKKYVKKGWALGVKQADNIFEQNLSLLKRDYLGMIRYRLLLAQNIVSAPYVSKRNYGVTGGGDKMQVNDRTLTITALPSLRADSQLWQPQIANFEEKLDKSVKQFDLSKLEKDLVKTK